MTDERRMMELLDGESLESQLLGAARTDGPGAASRAKILGGLGVAAGALPTGVEGATGSTSLAPAAAKTALGKWLVLGALALGVPTAAWLWSKSETPGATPTAAAEHETNPALDARPGAQGHANRAPQTTEAEDDAPVLEAEALPLEAEGAEDVIRHEQSRARQSPPLGTPSRTSPTSAEEREPSSQTARPSLSEELAAIRRARTALNVGNAAGALRELDTYHAAFPKGRLSQEARVMRIEALVKQGKRAQARTLAQPFLESKSPYSARVRSLIGE